VGIPQGQSQLLTDVLLTIDSDPYVNIYRLDEFVSSFRF
jgi:hypothetical protein